MRVKDIKVGHVYTGRGAQRRLVVKVTETEVSYYYYYGDSINAGEPFEVSARGFASWARRSFTPRSQCL